MKCKNFTCPANNQKYVSSGRQTLDDITESHNFLSRSPSPEPKSPSRSRSPSPTSRKKRRKSKYGCKHILMTTSRALCNRHLRRKYAKKILKRKRKKKKKVKA